MNHSAGHQIRILLVLLLSVLVYSCSSQTASLQQGPGAEVTYDGLVRVDNADWQRVWARPDFNISAYSKIMFGGSEIQYRPTRRTSSLSTRARNQTDFAISQQNRNRLESIVRDEFGTELARVSGFETVSEPGPDTLLLRINLSDVVSNVPPQNFSRRDIYLSEVGSATLTLELRDSESNAIIARAVDTRAAESMFGGLEYVSPITAWAEVRQLAARWGRLMRERIDQMAAEI